MGMGEAAYLLAAGQGKERSGVVRAGRMLGRGLSFSPLATRVEAVMYRSREAAVSEKNQGPSHSEPLHVIRDNMQGCLHPPTTISVLYPPPAEEFSLSRMPGHLHSSKWFLPLINGSQKGQNQ